MGEGVCEFVWVFIEVVWDFFVGGIFVEREVCSEYYWSVMFCGVVCVGYCVVGGMVDGMLLVGVVGFCDVFLFVVEEVFEVVVVLFGWFGCLSVFNVVGDCIDVFVGIEWVFLF